MGRKLTLYLAVLVAVFASCKKGNQQTASVIDLTRGSISGTVGPSGAVTGIKATNVGQSGIIYTAILVPASGTFKISNMVPGLYTLGFQNASSFAKHQDINDVTVTAGQDKDIGNISFEAGAFISGTISPLGSVLAVSGTNIQNSNSLPFVLDSVNGSFTSLASAAGKYSIAFYTVNGYKPPANIVVTLTAGQSVNLGTIDMLPNMLSGVPFSGGVSQSYAAPNLTINSTYNPDGSGLSIERFTISMDNITGPGTYTCKGTPGSNITYTISSSGGPFPVPAKSWSTNNTGGAGTIVVASIDAVKREIKGTFTGTLVSSTSGNANVVINNGKFYFAY